MPQNSLLGLLKSHVNTDPFPPLVSDSVNQVWDPRACISRKCPSGADAAGQGGGGGPLQELLLISAEQGH